MIGIVGQVFCSRSELFSTLQYIFQVFCSRSELIHCTISQSPLCDWPQSEQLCHLALFVSQSQSLFCQLVIVVLFCQLVIVFVIVISWGETRLLCARHLFPNELVVCHLSLCWARLLHLGHSMHPLSYVRRHRCEISEQLPALGRVVYRPKVDLFSKRASGRRP